MHSCVVFADIDVDLQWLPLKESNIEIVDFVFKAKLSLKVWSKAFSHLSRFSCVIIKINCAKGDQSSMDRTGNIL